MLVNFTGNIFILAKWVESTVNHFWWCIDTSENSDDLVERFRSIIFHVINRHHWPGCTYFKQCAHGNLSSTEQREVKWFKADSTAFKEFKKIILHINVTKDLQQIGQGVHTTSLESKFT